MERIPETELMDDPAHAKAYAEADFAEPHENFVDLFKNYYSRQSNDGSLSGNVLDLGCGTADVVIRFASRFPDCNILAVDGAEAMLKIGRKAVEDAGLSGRVTFDKRYLPDQGAPSQSYQAIISNSLLHHLKDAQSLWQTIKANANEGTFVFIMDLMRPRNENGAKELVEEHAGNESEILKKDFYNSLLAAYTIAEVEEQLEREQLIELKVLPVSDRHLIVHGVL